MEEKSTTAKAEEKVLEFWKENKIFEKTLEKDAPNGEFVFHDGPPFATGTPHHGHLVASAIKDAIPRYKTMNGYRVQRKWGWDCHGLPIENIVEKELGTKSKKDIEKLGVEKFNNLCREKIFTYVDVWNEFIPRYGRWVDMDNPYKTMDTSFMESEWWAFKELYDKGLVYEDYRSMHICPRCETTLAQSEVSEGYKTIKDLSVTVEFPLKDEENTSVLAWTTTPWTLPGNVALAVGKDIDYVTLEKKDEGEGKLVRFILAKEAVERVFGDDEHTIVSEMKGSELVGLEYTPPFDSYLNSKKLENKEDAWKIYEADFITTETGTGIAHEAPAFGAEDLELAQEVGLPIIQHVGMDGIIKPEVKELAGLSVKPIDDHQSTDVKVIQYLAGKGLLFAKEKYEHSYPHCWRCDTPLINYATSSWFVAVEKGKDDLLKYAKEINWSPLYIKEGRWLNWLEGARDWSISRQRFWANTIPVWRCKECDKETVFGNIKDLEEASGKKITDLHREYVDDIEIDCSCGGKMNRVPDVLDTWFNSGSVPYAQHHYPFEDKKETEAKIPADFIAEGLDQVSKWFYYQHVLSTAIFNKPAFKNVIVNGMVMAEDGKKMSKRLKNYPDPVYMIDKYGADAMRFYLLSSPVVRSEDLRFSEEGVDSVNKKVIGRLKNIVAFYELYSNNDVELNSSSDNKLDMWIISRLNELISEVTVGMEGYELDKATKPLNDFVDDFSTWYIRRSRDRYKGENKEDKKKALETTRYVLLELSKTIAPTMPFLAEDLYKSSGGEKESVHLEEWPALNEFDKDVLKNMEHTRNTVSLALEMRAESGVKVRQPLQQLMVDVSSVDDYLDLIKDEVNVKEVVIGDKLELDTEITPELKEEGEMRDLLRFIQQERKKVGLTPDDQATLTIDNFQDLVKKFEDIIKKTALLKEIIYEENDGTTVKVGGSEVVISIST